MVDKVEADARQSWQRAQDQWLDRTREVPGKHGYRAIGQCMAAIDWRPGTRSSFLRGIVTDAGARGQGEGRKVLKLIMDIAREHGLVLEAVAEPYVASDGALNRPDLISWYVKSGWVAVEGTFNTRVFYPYQPPPVDPYWTNWF